MCVYDSLQGKKQEGWGHQLSKFQVMTWVKGRLAWMQVVTKIFREFKNGTKMESPLQLALFSFYSLNYLFLVSTIIIAAKRQSTIPNHMFLVQSIHLHQNQGHPSSPNLQLRRVAAVPDLPVQRFGTRSRYARLQFQAIIIFSYEHLVPDPCDLIR